jgi:alkylation response protein AidB-like acyl-CoA dehydrogenase
MANGTCVGSSAEVSEDFKRELGDWLEANCPPSMRTPLTQEESPLGGSKEAPLNPETNVWIKRCADRGLTLPTTPREFGGAGLTVAESNYFYDELDRRRMRIPLMGIGTGMLASTLLKFGTEEQKLYFLPRIAAGKDRWGQSFSEPNAGSDLAALQLRAVRDGDYYVLNGQKIWNSFAHRSDGLITLVRTNSESARRQDGISFLLVDVDTPGVSVRPIQMIHGESEFCEVFFDDARVPVSRRVGEENSGWSVVKSLLVDDRKSWRRWFDSIHKLDLVGELKRSPSSSHALTQAVLDNELDDLAGNLLLNRIDRLVAQGSSGDSFAAVTKYWHMEHMKRRFDLLATIAEWSGITWSDTLVSREEASRTRAWLLSKCFSLGGGSSEVQLNILAKQVLNLPTR